MVSKQSLKEKVSDYQEVCREKSPRELLSYFLDLFSNRIALASSLSVEDQVLTDMVLKVNSGAKIFVLDTGRLHSQTYEVMSKTMEKYAMAYDIYFPNAQRVETMLKKNGPNLFYKSIECRKQCCNVRKVESLERALAELDVWITGIRKNQAVTRGSINTIEWDEANQLLKLNPLANWHEDDVWDYIKKYDVPYNTLHDQGFPSIGCAPCTRAIKKGEDIRAGRWWWEQPEHKECGLHPKSRKKE